MYKLFYFLISIVAVGLTADDRPNILLCISDDQSYAHTGANGDPVVKTPAFDRLAKDGLRFEYAFCNAPTCGPSRSALLTGQSIWRLEEAANIWSTLQAKFKTYPALLRDVGYSIGYTGKGWGPGKLDVGGRTENPVGPLFKGTYLKPRFMGINNTDYAGNFETFLNQTPKDKPFCFWLGTKEPHRGYEEGSGIKAGKDPDKVQVPGCFPDTPLVRSDILDYYIEVEYYDSMVERAVKLLEERGLLENTIVIVTSDHGMPFPRAKASLYDLSTRVPLAIHWQQGIKNPGRTVSSFVNLSDLAPTILDAAGVAIPEMMDAKSMLDIFADREIYQREFAVIAFERHSGSRSGGKGYPSRAIRTKDFLHIYNFEPDRLPQGSPNPEHSNRGIPYSEIDSSPTKTLMMEIYKKNQQDPLMMATFAKNQAMELYDMRKDPHQLNNVADNPEYKAVLDKLHKQLVETLKEKKDPRIIGGKVLWDYYPHYAKRKSKNWKVDKMPQELAK